MNRGLLSELPPPPTGKTGWPWTDETNPEIYSSGQTWPKISIVTPSYNQGQFIEETIRSVLLQNYPNLEYLIIDGASTDGTVNIIKKYEPWLTCWASEKDKGQSDAINKGIKKISGQVFNWINSDDYYLPHALNAVALQYRRHPNELIGGSVVDFDETGDLRITKQVNVNYENLISSRKYMSWHQPGIFIPVKFLHQVGEAKTKYRYLFDTEWYARMLEVTTLHAFDQPIVKFRLHNNSKTKGEAQFWQQEFEDFRNENLGKVKLLTQSYTQALVLTERSYNKLVFHNASWAAHSKAVVKIIFTNPRIVLNWKFYVLIRTSFSFMIKGRDKTNTR